jgi:hypothetical protein
MQKNKRVGIPLTDFDPSDNYGGGMGIGSGRGGQGVRLTHVNFDNRDSNETGGA